jgi:carboxyvinyl-carboxyphosphonate phosphorylmutase
MPLSPTQKRQQFRDLLATAACIRPASVFDPLSARAAAHLGFDVMMLGGSSASLAVLGAPDLVLLTATELAEHAGRIAVSADLPLLVDADHGYGNALNVMRTVGELERAGVAALTLEDTLLPAHFGGTTKNALVSIEEGIGRVEAAIAARSDAALLIVARTSAIHVDGVGEAIRRIQAYERAGADAMYLTGITSRDQLDAVAAASNLPLMIGMPPPVLDDPTYLVSRHVRVALLGHKPVRAAVAAAYAALAEQRDGTTKPVETLSHDLMAVLTEQAAYDSRLRQFMRVVGDGDR